MGAAPCAIIILEGTLAYGIIEKFSDKHPTISVYKLEAALKASCDSISFVGLYYYLENDKHISTEYTQPIIDLHARIKNELPNADNDAQNLVNSLANQLIDATRKLQELFE